MGLDINPNRQTFAYVIINEAKKIISRGEIRRSDLVTLIKKFRVEVLAIDNIFEIYETTEEIIAFLEITGVTLIQVTGPIYNQRPLAWIARQYGLHKGRLSPEKAAEVAAKLALMNIGAKVIPFHQITLISVSRARRFGHVGGSHQQQYLRSAHAKIRAVVNNILETLRAHKIKFDIITREGVGGYRYAKIICYAEATTIKRLIKSMETDWFIIKIRPIRRKRLFFLPLNTGFETQVDAHSRYIIVGVDPGETTGLAILDLSGNVLFVASRRGLGFIELIDKIYEFGRPLIIATDVPKIPHFVDLLSKKSGAIIYHPSTIISVSRKNEIVRKLGIRTEDSHQRDALVAAFMAYKHFERKFQKIDNISKYIPFIDPNKIKADVLTKNLDIRTAIVHQLEDYCNKVPESPTSTVNADPRLLEENKILREKYIEFKKEVETLRNENASLRRTIHDLQRQVENLSRTIKNLKQKEHAAIKRDIISRDSVLSELKNENDLLKNTINQLNNRISELENYNELLRRIAQAELDQLIVKRVDILDQEALDWWEKNFGITKRDLLLVRKISFSPNLLKRLSKVLGIILFDPNLVEPQTYDTLAQTLPLFELRDFEDIIDPSLLIQTVSLRDLKNRVRKILAERLSDLEAIYEEFVEALENYRKKRLEHLKE